MSENLLSFLRLLDNLSNENFEIKRAADQEFLQILDDPSSLGLLYSASMRNPKYFILLYSYVVKFIRRHRQNIPDFETIKISYHYAFIHFEEKKIFYLLTGIATILVEFFMIDGKQLPMQLIELIYFIGILIKNTTGISIDSSAVSIVKRFIENFGRSEDLVHIHYVYWLSFILRQLYEYDLLPEEQINDSSDFILRYGHSCLTKYVNLKGNILKCLIEIFDNCSFIFQSEDYLEKFYNEILVDVLSKQIDINYKIRFAFKIFLSSTEFKRPELVLVVYQITIPIFIEYMSDELFQTHELYLLNIFPQALKLANYNESFYQFFIDAQVEGSDSTEYFIILTLVLSSCLSECTVNEDEAQDLIERFSNIISTGNIEISSYAPIIVDFINSETTNYNVLMEVIPPIIQLLRERAFENPINEETDILLNALLNCLAVSIPNLNLTEFQYHHYLQSEIGTEIMNQYPETFIQLLKVELITFKLSDMDLNSISELIVELLSDESNKNESLVLLAVQFQMIFQDDNAEKVYERTFEIVNEIASEEMTEEKLNFIFIFVALYTGNYKLHPANAAELVSMAIELAIDNDAVKSCLKFLSDEIRLCEMEVPQSLAEFVCQKIMNESVNEIDAIKFLRKFPYIFENAFDQLMEQNLPSSIVKAAMLMNAEQAPIIEEKITEFSIIPSLKLVIYERLSRFGITGQYDELVTELLENKSLNEISALACGRLFARGEISGEAMESLFSAADNNDLRYFLIVGAALINPHCIIPILPSLKEMEGMELAFVAVRTVSQEDVSEEEVINAINSLQGQSITDVLCFINLTADPSLEVRKAVFKYLAFKVSRSTAKMIFCEELGLDKFEMIVETIRRHLEDDYVKEAIESFLNNDPFAKRFYNIITNYPSS